MTTLRTLYHFLLSANVVLASPILARSSYAVKESHHIPLTYRRIERALPTHMIDLSIGLKQSNFDELERQLFEVSDPSHHRYGKHLTAEEVNELVKPADDTWALVHEWLAQADIETHHLTYSPAKDWIRVSLPVSEIERLLDTEYSVFEHETGGRVVRTSEWSLPTHLHEHIVTVAPTNSFIRLHAESVGITRNLPRSIGLTPTGDVLQATNTADLAPRDAAADSLVASVCNASYVTPTCLRTLYGTIDYVPRAIKKNAMALNDFDTESNNRSDIKLFLKQFSPEAEAYADEFVVVVINNGDDQQTPDSPAQLANQKSMGGDFDAETIIPLVYPTRLTAYTTGGSPPFHKDPATPFNDNEPYLTWLHYVLSQTSLPYVISTSYGDDEQTVPPSFATAVCRHFAQLGARGVSLFFVAGDLGVGENGTCYTNDGTNKRQFIPFFPASCPYVTTVGNTKNFNPEVVAFVEEDGYAPGGGFSDYFPRPSYQEAVVPAYIASLDSKFKGLYNTTGRGYPDISANGQNHVAVWNGTNMVLTSCGAASSVAASIFALVNDALLSAGRPPLGFLNPWLYSQGYKGFNDVTSGSAIGCDTEGFPAQAGWDAVSGWGTPDFKKILAALNLTVN